MKKYLRGFTLAECLITLAIIGVVAAITIPNLMMSYEKNATVTKLLKGYNTINAAYQMSVKDNGIFDDEITAYMNNVEYFNKYWRPYIKVAKFCETYSDCGYKTNTPYTNMNNTADGTVVIESTRSAFITPDGILYLMFQRSGFSNTPSRGMFMDINAGKGPNKRGIDVFEFDRYDNGSIQPFGLGELDREINSNCSQSGLGRYCAEKIRRAGWKIDKTYYWNKKI